MVLLDRIFGISLLLPVLCSVDASQHRRFLVGGNLEQQLPQECFYLSEFVDLYDQSTKWTVDGEYVYLQLAYIHAKELRHEPLSNEDMAYKPLLSKLSQDQSSEFSPAYRHLNEVHQYGHELCLAILQYGIFKFLGTHTDELCQQFLTMDAVNAQSTCVHASTTTVAPNLSCKQCNGSSCSTNNTFVMCNANQMCLISVVDSAQNRNVYRGCIDISVCNDEQRKHNGYPNVCLLVDNGGFGFPSTCNFCCNKDNCNAGASLVPDRDSLYIASSSS